jgi:hypothetical protein
MMLKHHKANFSKPDNTKSYDKGFIVILKWPGQKKVALPRTNQIGHRQPRDFRCGGEEYKLYALRPQSTNPPTRQSHPTANTHYAW